MLVRQPDTWETIAHGIHVPLMNWQHELKLPNNTSENSKRLVYRLLAGKFATRRHTITNEFLASLLAARIQAGGSQSLFQAFNKILDITNRENFSYPYIDHVAGETSGHLAHDSLSQLMDEAIKCDSLHELILSKKIQNLFSDLSNCFKKCKLKPDIQEVLFTAIKNGIPVKRISDLPSYRLGYGKNQRKIWNTSTDTTSHMATIVAEHKSLTNSVLREHGFPTPRQFQADTVETALKAARTLSYPVVVKPDRSYLGIGATVRINNDTELENAFANASTQGRVVVEEFISGFDYRIHIINGRCAYAIKCLPPMVTGNGVDNVVQLVGKAAKARMDHPELSRYRLPSLSDTETIKLLKDQGVDSNSIIPEGKRIYLRMNTNLQTGGTVEIVSNNAHPDNIALAERATKCLGLDHAGVDFISRDITKSWRDIGGAINEINASPQIKIDAAKNEYLQSLFPNGKLGRIPIVLIIGTYSSLENIKATLVELTNQAMRTAGYIFNGTAHIGQLQVSKGRSSTRKLVNELLADPDLDCLIAQIEAEELNTFGLDIPYCDLVIYTQNNGSSVTVSRSSLSVARHTANTLLAPEPDQLTATLSQLFNRPGEAEAI